MNASKLLEMLRYWSLKDTGNLYEKKYVCTTDPGQNRWPKVKKPSKAGKGRKR